jgi:hypothetical protein
MRILKSLGGALAITFISAILLTITRGTPTVEQVRTNGIEMFVVAFVVLYLFVVKKS